MSGMRFISREFYLVEPYRFEVREKVIEEIPEGHLLLRPIIAGICGSETLYFRGEKEPEKLKARLPMCLLHEGVAEVVEAGEGTRLKVGTKVVVNPMIPCGKCHACKSGMENLCQNARYMAATANGLARTLFTYPEERVIPIPRGVEPEVAALTEPLTIALNAIEESGIREGELVAVIGDGPIGYFIALLASRVRKVSREHLYLIGVVDEKLSLARDFASTINSARESEKLAELSGMVDIVFEAVGGRAHRLTIREAIDLLKPGGKCLLLGISMGDVPVNVTKIVNKGLTFRGVTRSRMEHYIKILDLLKEKSFSAMVKRVISSKKFIIREAEDLAKAFRYADTEIGEGRVKPGRVLVYFP